jgi:hypothetical protein
MDQNEDMPIVWDRELYDEFRTDPDMPVEEAEYERP